MKNNNYTMQDAINQTIKNVYDIWDDRRLNCMIKSVINNLGTVLETDTYRFCNMNGLELFYDTCPVTGEEVIEVYLEKDGELIIVYENNYEYTKDFFSEKNNPINKIWIDKLYDLYFEANKPLLYCSLKDGN